MVDTTRGKRKHIQRDARGSPRGDADILLHVTCILLIMTFPIVQMVSCRGPPQNTGPQAIACRACPIATPLIITGESKCKGRGRQQTERISKNRQGQKAGSKRSECIGSPEKQNTGETLRMSAGAKQDFAVSARKCAAYMCVCE